MVSEETCTVLIDTGVGGFFVHFQVSRPCPAAGCDGFRRIPQLWLKLFGVPCLDIVCFCSARRNDSGSSIFRESYFSDWGRRFAHPGVLLGVSIDFRDGNPFSSRSQSPAWQLLNSCDLVEPGERPLGHQQANCVGRSVRLGGRNAVASFLGAGKIEGCCLLPHMGDGGR